MPQDLLERIHAELLEHPRVRAVSFFRARTTDGTPATRVCVRLLGQIKLIETVGPTLEDTIVSARRLVDRYYPPSTS